ncbi:MAG TPA: SdpI family protein [Agriterribacter sp.]|nr:SdpI family protein [Agriterribacter sp.]
MKKPASYWVWIISLVPIVFLAAIWQKIPGRVPLHYNLSGEADRYGSKTELILLAGILFVSGIGSYLLIANAHRLDPKKKYTAENLGLIKRFALIVVYFMSAMSCYIIYTKLNTGAGFSPQFITALSGLMFAAIGNYMPNIKPNYFAGIRLPWTLESEDNWKYTHRLGGKVWFAGGLVITALSFLLPVKAGFIAMYILIAIMVIIPSVYSYRFYKRTQNTQ